MASGEPVTTKPKSSRRLMASVVGLLLLLGVGLMLWLKSGQGDVATKPLSPAAKPPVAAVVSSPAKPAAVPVAPVVAKPELPPGISGDPMEAFAWDGKLQGMHIMSMCKDTRGRLWVGTEGNGAWCWDPNVALKQLQAEQAWTIERKRLGTPESAAPAKAKLYGWSQHTRVTTGGKPEEHGPVLTTGTSDVNSLGDDCVYAIACDKQGRIWTGHLNHGVSVYDGRQIPIKQPEKGYEGWRNYDVLSGPLGERVFDIGVNPVDGDVWIATDAGLSRYRVAADVWDYVTRANGLPADQVQALAFLKDGSVVAGTQCDGLGIAAPVAKPQPAEDKAIPAGDKVVASTLEYPTWRQVTTEDNSYDLPKTPIGVGLPSNLINDLLVARDGTLWVATTTGIAKSTDGGKTWIFIRGEDWEAKLRGLAEPPTNDEINIAKQLVPARPQALLLEDYTTTLAEDAAGNLWIGHWRRGLEIMNAKGERLCPDPKMTIATSGSAYVRAIESNLLGRAVTGCYGSSLVLEPMAAWQKVEPIVDNPNPIAQIELPKSAAIPTKEEFLAITKKLAEPVLPKGKGPWGKFLGEDWMTQGDWMGRYGRRYTFLCAMGMPFTHEIGHGMPYWAFPKIGKHPDRQDCARAWCWQSTCEDRRVLFLPTMGYRRPAGWDDHGEAYSSNLSGPDLWIVLAVPEGIHAVSFYFVNYDGKTGWNQRDYLLELRTSFEGGDVLARSRVRDWWGGVYKQFAIQGPQKYYLHISRNHSFNVMINAVMFDKIEAPQHPTDDLFLAFMTCHYDIPRIDQNLLKDKLDFLEKLSHRWPFIDSANKRIAISYAANNSNLLSLYENLLWKQRIWDDKSRNEFIQAMNNVSKFWESRNKKKEEIFINIPIEPN